MHSRSGCRVPLRALALGTSFALVALGGCSDGGGQAPSSGSGTPAQTAASGSTESTILGPVMNAEPTGSLPWAFYPVLAEGNTIVGASTLMEEATEDMWSMGAGLTAMDLASGEQLWHLDYSDQAFGIDPATRPTDASASVSTNKAGQFVAIYSSLTCPNDECADDQAEDFALVTIDGATGAVLSSLTGVGVTPMVIAFINEVVVYTPDWENAVAVKADAVDGEPVWSSPIFNIYDDALIDGALFTTLPEYIDGALGWVNVVDGTPASYTLDLDAYEGVLVADAETAVVTTGTGEDHTVSLVNPTTSEVAWEATVPMADDESEVIELTASRVVLSYDSESAYRTVVLDRERGGDAWARDDGSAGLVTDRWALINDAGTAVSWPVVNVEDGTEVTIVDASPETLPSVHLGEDTVLIAHSGILEARPLTGDNAGSDAPVWSVATDMPDAEITAEFGELLLIDLITGATRTVTPPTGTGMY